VEKSSAKEFVYPESFSKDFHSRDLTEDKLAAAPQDQTGGNRPLSVCCWLAGNNPDYSSPHEFIDTGRLPVPYRPIAPSVLSNWVREVH
jgi:hypothetical protein